MGYLQLNLADATLVNGTATIPFSVTVKEIMGTVFAGMMYQVVGNGVITWTNAQHSDGQHAFADGDCYVTVDWGPLIAAMAPYGVNSISLTVESELYPDNNGTSTSTWTNWQTVVATQVQQIHAHVKGNGSSPLLDDGALRKMYTQAYGMLVGANYAGALVFDVSSPKSWGCRPLPID